MSTCHPTSSRWSRRPFSVVGCAVPSNASHSACLTRSRFTKLVFGHPYPRSSGSVALFGYGWAERPSAGGCGRLRGTRRRARARNAPATSRRCSSHSACRSRAVRARSRRHQFPVDPFQGVVRPRGTARTSPRGVRARRELGAPERRLVGLVADHELPDLGIDLGNRGYGRREERRAPETRLDLPRRVRIHREHDAQPRVECVRDDPVEEPLVLDDDRLVGLKRTPITVCRRPTAAISPYIAAPWSAACFAESSLAPTSAARARLLPARRTTVKAIAAASSRIRFGFRGLPAFRSRPRPRSESRQGAGLPKRTGSCSSPVSVAAASMAGTCVLVLLDRGRC